MQKLTDECLRIIQPRPPKSHRGHFGRVVLVGGNPQYGGAIIMSAEACVRAGACLVTVITDAVNHAALHARLPEVMVVDWQHTSLVETVLATADVCLIGPGLGLAAANRQLFARVLAQQTANQWLVIDGSAITLLAEQPLPIRYPTQVVFTPHQMEWQRLSGLAIAEQHADANEHAQAKLQATVVLKSHRTEIYSPAGCVQNPLGNPAMATGGTGDTLAGIIAAFLAQFSQKNAAIQAAVYLHSHIGDQLARDRYVVLPTEISAALPYWMHMFQKKFA